MVEMCDCILEGLLIDARVDVHDDRIGTEPFGESGELPRVLVSDDNECRHGERLDAVPESRRPNEHVYFSLSMVSFPGAKPSTTWRNADTGAARHLVL